MTTFTSPHGLPIIEPSTDNIKDGSEVSALASDLNAISLATNSAIGAEGARAVAAAAADASAKDAAIDAKATSAVSTANNASFVAEGASSDAENAVDRVTALESAAGFGPSTPTDGTMADYIASPASLTASQLSIRIAERTSAIVTDHGAATLQAVINAAQAGDTVEIRRAWTIGATITVSKRLNIRCARGGSVSTAGNVHAFDVTASSVSFDEATITGSGGSAYGTQAGIRAIGTALAPITGLTVRNCAITGFHQFGIEGRHVHGFTIERNRIENIGYAGVMLVSPKDGQIGLNTVRNITEAPGFVDSYGIAVTRDSSKSIAESPRAYGVRIYQNLVDGVPKWEGIDTHAGEDILIVGNIIRNCHVGIGLVPSPNASGQDTWAPKRIKALGNTIASGVTDGSRHIGIQLVGCITDAGALVEYADAVIRDNTVDGHGDDANVLTGGIFLQATIGTVVSGNTITEAAVNAIIATVHNKGLTLDGNTAVDTWTNAQAFTSTIRVSSNNNTIRGKGNAAIRANKTATLVNQRGLFVASAASTTIQWDDNDMSATTLGDIDAGASFTRVMAAKMSFSAAKAPITRPVLNAAATDEATARTLVNQMRTALINYGITT